MIMNELRFLFRVDATAETGLGHYTRSFALAEYLSYNFSCFFLMFNPIVEVESNLINSEIKLIKLDSNNSEDQIKYLKDNVLRENDILIFDGYNFDSDYIKSIKNTFDNYTILIDDIYLNFQHCNLIINTAGNSTIDKYNCQENTTFCLGLSYSLLRKSFLEQAKLQREISNIDTIFICLGGADLNNITLEVLKSVLSIEKKFKVHVVVGGAYQYLDSLNLFIKTVFSNSIVYLHRNLSAEEIKNLIIESQIAICSSSVILSECYSVGLFVISGYYIENQFQTYEFAKSNNLIYPIGDLNNLNKLNLKSIIEDITIDNVNQMIQLQKSVIDGSSLKRLQKKIIQSYFDSSLICRKANKEDIYNYFELVNDSEVRKSSINTEIILFENHEKWFTGRILSPNTYMFAFYLKQTFVGQVRFDKNENNNFIIDYSICAPYRGLGLGFILLKKSINQLKNYKLQHAKLVAEVKLDNFSSNKTMLNLGFELQATTDLINQYTYDIK
ncbi:MAG: hypothetical protein RLZZ175_2720 [Bacteroidota bacterium]|jgi:UDP-2,4-diacetamido-2,4,6-trideoxy-beta-L-altropyranose hydrolase